jgi:hypothetical protein
MKTLFIWVFGLILLLAFTDQNQAKKNQTLERNQNNIFLSMPLDGTYIHDYGIINSITKFVIKTTSAYQKQFLKEKNPYSVLQKTVFQMNVYQTLWTKNPILKHNKKYTVNRDIRTNSSGDWFDCA